MAKEKEEIKRPGWVPPVVPHVPRSIEPPPPSVYVNTVGSLLDQLECLRDVHSLDTPVHVIIDKLTGEIVLRPKKQSPAVIERKKPKK